VWFFAVVYDKSRELDVKKLDLLTKLGIQEEYSDGRYDLTEYGWDIYRDCIKEDVVTFDGFEQILVPLLKVESVTTKELKKICQSEYKLRVMRTLEFFTETKNGHWSLTKDALEDMYDFVDGVNAQEEDSVYHEEYLLIKDKLATFDASVKPVDMDSQEKPPYSEVALKIMEYLQDASDTVAGIARKTGLSQKIIKNELLDMYSKDVAIQMENGRWCLSLEAEEYVIEKLHQSD
jgi:hypothetical protein